MTCFTTAIACGGDDGTDDAAGTTGDDPTTGSPTGNPSTDDSTSIDPSTTDDPTTGPDDTTGDPTLGGTTAADDSGGTTAADDTAGSDETGGDPACAMYCTDFFDVCGDVENTDQYDDTDACLAACAGFPPDDGMAMGGGDLECRLYHLSMSPGMEDVHCQHADIDGSGVCVP